MKPIQVNYDKCNADGICAEVCPRKLIGYPVSKNKGLNQQREIYRQILVRNAG